MGAGLVVVSETIPKRYFGANGATRGSMRKNGRIDRNQPEIVKALRKAGASVLSLANHGSGCPDLLVGFREHNFLLEVKDPMQPPSRRRLTEDEELWHNIWSGHVAVVETVEDAMRELWEARCQTQS